MADVGGYFRSLIDASGYLILVEFSEFFRYGIDINGNLRLMDLSGFFKFWFRVRVVHYRAFLLAIGGGK